MAYSRYFLVAITALLTCHINLLAARKASTLSQKNLIISADKTIANPKQGTIQYYGKISLRTPQIKLTCQRQLTLYHNRINIANNGNLSSKKQKLQLQSFLAEGNVHITYYQHNKGEKYRIVARGDTLQYDQQKEVFILTGGYPQFSIQTTNQKHYLFTKSNTAKGRIAISLQGKITVTKGNWQQYIKTARKP